MLNEASSKKKECDTDETGLQCELSQLMDVQEQ